MMGRGIIVGLTIALCAFAAGAAIHIAVDTYWPPACDGTASTVVCLLRIARAQI